MVVGRSVRHEGRIIAGLATQPVIAGLFGVATFPFIAYVNRGVEPRLSSDYLEGALAIGLLTAIVGLIVTVFCALPLLLLFLRRGPVTIAQTLISGALLGNVPTAVVMGLEGLAAGRRGEVLRRTSEGTAIGIRAVLLGTFIGLVCSSIFWLIARRTIAPAPEQFADSSPFVV